ncbi:MAG: ABC transporter substrate binding protein [Aquificota bacterium]|nr:ABC transporter substrate binding protein [Aquificota bacterium]
MGFLLFLSSCEGGERDYRIAVFISGEGRLPKVRGFLSGLKELGVKNLKIDFYEGDNTLSRMRELARDLARVQDRYDLIAVGGSLEAHMIKEASGKLRTPVVILGGTSIIEWKLTKSLSESFRKHNRG